MCNCKGQTGATGARGATGTAGKPGVDGKTQWRFVEVLPAPQVGQGTNQPPTQPGRLDTESSRWAWLFLIGIVVVLISLLKD